MTTTTAPALRARLCEACGETLLYVRTADAFVLYRTMDRATGQVTEMKGHPMLTLTPDKTGRWFIDRGMAVRYQPEIRTSVPTRYARHYCKVLRLGWVNGNE